MSDEIKVARTHPVQRLRDIYFRDSRACVPEPVALRAYEVYCEVYGPQPAMVDLEGRDCRGGFGVNELIMFLYARSFPEKEWRQRVEEAAEGMKL